MLGSLGVKECSDGVGVGERREGIHSQSSSKETSGRTAGKVERF
jgi:hypothetical protein